MSALLGGAMIGMAAVAMMALLGRVAGISGIVGGLFRAEAGDRAWRIAFVLGLVSAPLGYLASGRAITISIGADTAMLVLAGIFVGVGTQMGSGCTSGHGVCGLARLSPRSLVATCTFMAAAGLTVYMLRHGGF